MKTRIKLHHAGKKHKKAENSIFISHYSHLHTVEPLVYGVRVVRLMFMSHATRASPKIVGKGRHDSNKLQDRGEATRI